MKIAPETWDTFNGNTEQRGSGRGATGHVRSVPAMVAYGVSRLCTYAYRHSQASTDILRRRVAP
eukprot:1546765-Rhodomonas_salina.2